MNNNHALVSRASLGNPATLNDKVDLYDNIEVILENTPQMIQDVVQLFSSIEEKLVALYSALVISGTFFPNVIVNYNNRENYLALMLMIVAPPASGKGALSQVKKIGMRVDLKLREDYNVASKKYKTDLRLYKQAEILGTEINEPSRPVLKMVEIPGNVSSAKMIQQLAENGPNMMGLIAETEIDTLGVSSKTSYGELFTTFIRNAFHHERISSLRKTNAEFLDVPTPKLAFILSGTLSQLKSFIPSNEDGTFSRLMILKLNGSLEWKDVTPSPDHISIDQKIDILAEKFLNIFEAWSERKVTVKFHVHHWKAVNTLGETNLKMSSMLGEHATSIAKRHPLMLVRLAGILTMLRNFADLKTEVFYCEDVDFDIALQLIEYSLTLSLDLFQELPGENKPSLPYPALLLESLPTNFEFKDLRRKTFELGYQQVDRTLQRWINDYINEGAVMKIKKGHFTKTNNSYGVCSDLIDS